MPNSLCEMIHPRGLPPALHIEAVLEFRTREAKSLISPVNGTTRSGELHAAAAFSGKGEDAAASCALRTEISDAGIQPK